MSDTTAHARSHLMLGSPVEAHSETPGHSDPGQDCGPSGGLTRRLSLCCLLIAGWAIQVPSVCAQPTTTVAQNGEARLRVFSEGIGPAIVLLPGQGRGPRDYDDLTRYIVEAGFRVVRPEPRGYGESVGPIEGVTLRDLAADVAAAIEVAAGKPAIVVGWAYGNRVARMLATDKPDLVRGVVLIAAGGRFPPKQELMADLRSYQDRTLPLQKRAEIARSILFGPKSNVSQEDMRLDDVSSATIKAQSSANASTPAQIWWNGGSGPMLILQGLHDVLAPVENGRSLKADHPDRVTLVEFPEFGHGMVREDPRAVAKAITEWVAKLPR